MSVDIELTVDSFRLSYAYEHIGKLQCYVEFDERVTKTYLISSCVMKRYVCTP